MAHAGGKNRFLDLARSLCDEYDWLHRQHEMHLTSQGLLVLPQNESNTARLPGSSRPPLSTPDRHPPSERPWGFNSGCPPPSVLSTSTQLSQFRQAEATQIGQFQQAQRTLAQPNTFSLLDVERILGEYKNCRLTELPCAKRNSDVEKLVAESLDLRELLAPSTIEVAPEPSKGNDMASLVDGTMVRSLSRQTSAGEQSLLMTPKSTGAQAQKMEEVSALAKEIVEALGNEPPKPDIPPLKRGATYFVQNSSWDLLIKMLMNFVTVLNIVLMGFEADSPWPGWLVINVIFAMFFTAEIIHRFAVDGAKSMNPRTYDASWLYFDIALVFMQVVEIVLGVIELSQTGGADDTSSFAWMRTARLIRLCRILRLMEIDFCADLLLMVHGALGGMRTLGFVVVMLCVPLYAFALFMNQTVGQYDKTAGFDVGEHFSTVGRAMFTGYRCLVIGDCSALDGTPIFAHILKTRSYGWIVVLAYGLTSVFMTFALFNVIVAIYVENTVSSAKSNQGLQRQRRLANVTRFAEQIVSLTRFLWMKKQPEDAAAFTVEKALQMDVERDFFQGVIDDFEMHHLLQDLDVPREDHLDLFDICDADGSGVVSMDELVAGIKRLRGDPRRSDVVFIMLRINEILSEIQAMRAEMLEELNGISNIRKSLSGVDSETLTRVDSGMPAEV